MRELDAFPPSGVSHTVQHDRCREKTARGNSYHRRSEAEMAATSMSRKHGERIEAFQCPICMLYHVGKVRS